MVPRRVEGDDLRIELPHLRGSQHPGSLPRSREPRFVAADPRFVSQIVDGFQFLDDVRDPLWRRGPPTLSNSPLCRGVRCHPSPTDDAQVKYCRALKSSTQ